ncbi:2TM domain-containing protein, partial [Pseudoalteromonas sp. Z1A6]|uniref:2TM domain-containing protein n=1 Tax=Pseudoalteromonas sp. Z1A6 TaxID=2686349 RepID=UPI003211CDCF
MVLIKTIIVAYIIWRIKMSSTITLGKKIKTYLLILTLLTVINLLTSPSYMWVVWPALGMGIGLVVSALSKNKPRDI